MRRSLTVPTILLALGAAMAGGHAVAQPARPAPPPPGWGLCTPQFPCTDSQDGKFYYTPSGDRRYLSS